MWTRLQAVQPARLALPITFSSNAQGIRAIDPAQAIPEIGDHPGDVRPAIECFFDTYRLTDFSHVVKHF